MSEEHGHDHDHSEHAHGEPSNAQEAFQFLAFGAGIVLVIRLIVAAFGLWSGDASGDTLAEACAPFRNGYPLIGKHTLVVGGLPMIPRLAVAGLFVLTMGLLFAVLLLPLGAALKWGTLRGAVLGGRIGLLLGSAWAIYCLLCLPPHHVEVSEAELIRHDRAAFLGVIAWPIIRSAQAYTWNEIERIGPAEGKEPTVVAYTATVAFPIAEPSSRPSGPPEETEQRTANADRLIAALNTLRR